MTNIFNWMFGYKDFIPHVKKMLIISIVFYVLGAGLWLYSSGLMPGIFKIVMMVVASLFLLCPTFLQQGYYWCLTENIIDRRVEVAASSVYDGRVNTKETFELPEFSIRALIWRGVASTVACLILILPVAGMVALLLWGSVNVSEFWNLDSEQLTKFYILCGIFIVSLFPALLWNYAKRDSVIAVLNIRKAIYLIGNYPVQYIKNVGIMLVLGIALKILFSVVQGILGTGIIQSVLMVIISFFIGLYALFVFAYLHGTIAPPGEGV